MKGVQCYEIFGGIALKNHAFSFHLEYANVIWYPNMNINQSVERVKEEQKIIDGDHT